MKSNDKILLQGLQKPEPKVDMTISGIGREYTGFRIEEILWLNKFLVFEPMRAFEFENGAVASSFHSVSQIAANSRRMPRIIYPNCLVAGQYQDVSYICRKRQSPEVLAFIADLLDHEKDMYLQRNCNLVENLKAIKAGENVSVGGWLNIVDNFMFFVDMDLFQNTKNCFGFY